MINVSIDARDFVNWAGGVEFLINMLTCLSYVNTLSDTNRLKITVILPRREETKEKIVERIMAVSPSIERYYYDNKQLKDVIQHIGSDLCFVVAKYVRNTSVPQIVYIPDLQEEYLKELFSVEEILSRRKRNRYLFNVAKHAFVTSNTVKKDIDRFYDSPDIKYHILPCLPMLSEEYWDTSYVELNKYKLPQDYYLVSNQFWQHKDHLTVFKAANHIVNELKQNIHIVCTGLMEDYRNVNYIQLLKRYLDDNNLWENIHLLGFIPRSDQLEIMKRSYAVIQPTLFEGGAGGFSAQEAISIGKRIILSDIEINKELSTYTNVTYFAHGDYVDLSKKLISIKTPVNGYSIKKIQELYNDHIESLALFYSNMIDEVIQNGG